MMIKYSSRRVVYEANDAKVVMFPYQMYKLISNKMNSVYRTQMKTITDTFIIGIVNGI